MVKFSKPPLYIREMAVYPFSQEIVEALTFKSKFGEEICLAKVVQDKVYVPVGCAPESKNDYRVTKIPFALDCKIIPRNEDQAQAINTSIALLKQGTNHILEAPTGWGKCLKKGTPILMYDGSLKPVEAVVEGDKLMGVDSNPRTAYGITVGRSRMYRITPLNGDPWVCNDAHILSLKMTGDPKFGGYKKGDIVNLPVSEYLNKSKTFKHVTKLWKVGVDFPTQTLIGIDPYHVGMLLGDGGLTNSRVGFTTTDSVMEAEFYNLCHQFHVSVARTMTGPRLNVTQLFAVGGGAGVRHGLAHHLQRLGLLNTHSGNKFIPDNYKVASREHRLQLIAGLLDTDGSLKAGNVFDYVSKSETLARDFTFVCRSLGFKVTISECGKTCGNTGVTGTYWRCCLSGDTHVIPTKLAHKKAIPRLQKKDPLVCGFTVEELPEDDYYGFAVDQDHLFILGDFTVTHNTAAGIGIALELKQPTLILVTKSDLIDGWRKTLLGLAKIPSHRIGHVQAAVCDWKGKDFVIGMIHSVIRDGKYPPEFYDHFGLVIWDETHRVGAEFFMKSCEMFPARLRLGLSATPDRSDGKMPSVFAHIGPVMSRGNNVPMNPKILVVKTGWHIPKVDADGKPIFWSAGKMASVSKQMGLSKSRNSIIIEFVKSAHKSGRSTVIMSDLLEGHLSILYKLLIDAGIPAKDIGYYVGGMKKPELDIAKVKPIVLATYAMCSEGTDVPQWDTLVMATPRANVKQIIGRVMRVLFGKKEPVVLDLVDQASVYHGYHRKRLTQYFEVNATIVQM